MADSLTFGAPWTDPRAMLAQALMQNSADTSPVRSWTQEAARALAGPVGAWELNQLNDGRAKALSSVGDQMFGASPQAQSDSAAPSSADGPSMLGRIGNFLGLGGSAPPSTPAATDANAGAPPTNATGAVAMGQTNGAPPAASALNTSSPTDASPQSFGSALPAAAPVSPQGAVLATPSPPSPASPQTATNSPQGTPTLGGIPGAPPVNSPFAQHQAFLRTLYNVGKQQGGPNGYNLMQQAVALRQNLMAEQAKAQVDATTDLYKQGMVLDPNTNTVTQVGGYRDIAAGNKGAESGASKQAEANVDLAMQPQILAAENPAMIARAGGEQGARNASDLSYAAPIATARDTAAANVALNTQPTIEAAKADAINKANAQKPLTPQQIDEQEQKVSHDFMQTDAYKNHYNAVEGYKNVLSAAQGTDKASDINLIDGLVKMFNPGATVRQSTFENFMDHSQGVPDNVKGMVHGWFTNDQHLQPETRAQLVAQATERMNSSRQLYNPVVSFLQDTAARQGLNPKNVLPPLIDPITAQEIARQRGLAK